MIYHCMIVCIKYVSQFIISKATFWSHPVPLRGRLNPKPAGQSTAVAALQSKMICPAFNCAKTKMNVCDTYIHMYISYVHIICIYIYILNGI